MARRSKAKRKRKSGMRLIAVFVLALLCVVGYNSLGLAEAQAKKEMQLATVNQQIEEEEQRTKMLEQKKAYVQTKEYIEEIARRYLGLMYPDEIKIQAE